MHISRPNHLLWPSRLPRHGPGLLWLQNIIPKNFQSMIPWRTIGFINSNNTTSIESMLTLSLVCFLIVNVLLLVPSLHHDFFSAKNLITLDFPSTKSFCDAKLVVGKASTDEMGIGMLSVSTFPYTIQNIRHYADVHDQLRHQNTHRGPISKWLT